MTVTACENNDTPASTILTIHPLGLAIKDSHILITTCIHYVIIYFSKNGTQFAFISYRTSFLPPLRGKA